MAQRHTHPHMSKKLFKIARSGRVIGDFTAKQICEGILSGHFLGTDHYWDQELNEWRFVREKDWQASAEEIETKEKSVWTKPIKGLSFLDFSHGWWMVGIPVGIYRLCFKNSRSGSDSQIVGWTLIAGLIATSSISSSGKTTVRMLIKRRRKTTSHDSFGPDTR